MKVTSGYSFKTEMLPTSAENVVAGSVSVYHQNNTVYVVSAPDNLIKTIDVYTMQGTLVYSNTNVNDSSCSFTVQNSLPEIYMVKVATNTGVECVKVVNK